MRQLTFGKLSIAGGVSKTITAVGTEQAQICPSQDYDPGYEGQGCVVIKLGDTAQMTFMIGGGYFVP